MRHCALPLAILGVIFGCGQAGAPKSSELDRVAAESPMPEQVAKAVV